MIRLVANLDEPFNLFRKIVMETCDRNIQMVCSTGSKLWFHEILLKSFSSHFNTSPELSSSGCGPPTRVEARFLKLNGLQCLYDLIYLGTSLIQEKEVDDTLSQLAFLRPGLIQMERCDEEMTSNGVVKNRKESGMAARRFQENVSCNKAREAKSNEVTSMKHSQLDDEGEMLQPSSSDQQYLDPNLSPRYFDLTQEIVRKIRKALPDTRLFRHGPRCFECFICSKFFQRRQSLRIHLLAHYLRSYRCPKCSTITKYHVHTSCKQSILSSHGLPKQTN